MSDELDEDIPKNVEIIDQASTQDDMYLVPQDTPINKATLAELEYEQQLAFVEKLQERRTRAYVQLGKAKVAKGKSVEAQNLAKAVKFDKLIDKLEKELAKVDKSLTKVDEIVDELKVMRLTQGDRDE